MQIGFTVRCGKNAKYAEPNGICNGSSMNLVDEFRRLMKRQGSKVRNR